MSLQGQRHEAHFAGRIGDAQKRGPAALAPELFNPLLHIFRGRDRFLSDLHDDVPGHQAPLRRIRPLVDANDDNPVDAVADLVAGAQFVAQVRKFKAKRLLDR